MVKKHFRQDPVNGRERKGGEEKAANKEEYGHRIKIVLPRIGLSRKTSMLGEVKVIDLPKITKEMKETIKIAELPDETMFSSRHTPSK